MASNRLNISVGIHQSQSRAGLITSATLPEASEIGIKLDGYDDADNIKFTAATQDSKQVWNPASDIVLDETKGTLYAYYPWKDGTDLSAITIETASQTDYLYATPVTGICETKANADVVMNHVFTNINLSFADGTYAGVGNITSVSVSGDGIATGGTFNAAQETPAFVADSYTGVGDAITNTTATTLGGTDIDIMVVSNDASAPITITATIDGVEYTATTSAVELAKGNSYQYTLTLNSTFMSVSNVSVTPWNNVVKDNLTMQKPVDKTIKVYAVSSTNALIDYTTADNTAKGVAIVAGEHKFMIANSDATNDGSNYYLYYDYDKVDLSLTNYSNADGTNSFGYLGGSSAYVLPTDFTTWTAGALSDFNGKSNTQVIAASSSNAKDMCKVLETFNAGSDNQGHSDWYVPAAGQLALMYLAKTDINAALAKIGGTAFNESYTYWSSSECDADYAWRVDFSAGIVCNYSKGNNHLVRFVRDI